MCDNDKALSLATRALAMRLGRAALGMSQQEFADMLGIAKSTVARNETMEMAMRADTMTLMHHALRERGVVLDIINAAPSIKLDVDKVAIEQLHRRLGNNSYRRSDRKKR